MPVISALPSTLIFHGKSIGTYQVGPGRATGHKSAESCKNSHMNADSKPLRWSGAGLVPADFMSWQATTPLVVLKLNGSRLTLRFRPALLARFLGIETLTAAPDDKPRIFPIQNDRTWKGIEFGLPGRSSFRFYTRHREASARDLDESWFCCVD
jgi:hypothetical protein